MNRREFLLSVAAAIASKQLVSKLAEQSLDDLVGHWGISTATYPAWGHVISSSSRPLSAEMLREARDRIWNDYGRPTLYDQRFYERTGLLISL